MLRIRSVLGLFGLGLLTATAQAQTKAMPAADPMLPASAQISSSLTSTAAIDACLSAINEAERKYRIPTGLLLAIARTESGRPDPRTGRVQPWPWTVDVAGAGAYFPSAAEAVQHVTVSLQHGATSIDTGCLQVNLQQHPAAFKTLNDALEPSSNVDYAARFLAQLHNQTGDWARASCFYHSHTPELGIPYLQMVKVHLGVAAPQTDVQVEQRHVMVDALKAAWGATLPGAAPDDRPAWSPPSAPGLAHTGTARLGTRRAMAAQVPPITHSLARIVPILATAKNVLLTGSCV